MKFDLMKCCTVDRTVQCIKMTSNLIQIFGHYLSSNTPGMEPVVCSYTKLFGVDTNMRFFHHVCVTCSELQSNISTIIITIQTVPTSKMSTSYLIYHRLGRPQKKWTDH